MNTSNTFVALAITMLFTSASCSTTSDQKEIHPDFGWLPTSWSSTLDSSVVLLESWASNSNDPATFFDGKGCIVQLGDTTCFEILAIVMQNDSLFYRVILEEGSEPVNFHINHFDKNSFSAVNANNEHPKRIDYQLVDSNTLKVQLTGNHPPNTILFKRVNDFH
ncbi:MAG: hypothetical protein ACI8ZN_001982 [Bacteroidia bacterium]|jgi:hypothetical protein